MSLEELQKEIRIKEQELAVLHNKLKEYPNVVLMKHTVKGKHTFVLQPIKQINNLKANGWAEFTTKNIEKLIKILNKN